MSAHTKIQTGKQTAIDRPDFGSAAKAAIAPALKAGAIAYDRRRDLPRLIRFVPNETPIDAQAPVDAEAISRAIVARLERALRAERSKARSGHWSYDLNRHIALRQAHRAESERLALMKT